MKLIIKVKGENLALVEDLKKDGINAKLVKGACIIEPKRIEVTDKEWYEIPEQLKDDISFTLNIDISECGGGMTKTGHARIICDKEGRELHPYFIPKHGHLACSDHAYFSVPYEVYTVENNRDDVIHINKIIAEADITGSKVRMIEDSIWIGEIDSLPERYSRFSAAAEAAMKKAADYHCRTAYYVK